MRLSRPGTTLDEQERLSVVVTELIKLGTAADVSTRIAARQVLTALLEQRAVADEDRRVVHAVLSVTA